MNSARRVQLRALGSGLWACLSPSNGRQVRGTVDRFSDGGQAITSSPEPRAPSAFLVGFSLIELVISMAILSVGLVGAMRVFPVGLRASQRSEVRSRATILAQRTIESLKLKRCEDLADGEVTEEGFVASTRISQPQIEQLADPTKLKQVEVDVTSTSEGQPRSLTFVTYVWCGAS